MTTHKIIEGDCIEAMQTLPDASVHCCVTSPPYWGLRDYGHDGQIGLEATPEAYVARLVEVFREVRRLLRDDGTCWVNLGDSYAGSWGNQGRKPTRGTQRDINGPMIQRLRAGKVHDEACCLDEDCLCPAGEGDDIYPDKQTCTGSWVNDHPTLKAKDLVGIPWRVAFALQADGWWLRQDIIWHKPNPMPESVRDRCTKAHEYVFLLTKSEQYYYDAEAVSEALSGKPHKPGNKCSTGGGHLRNDFGTDAMERVWGANGRRNRRSVWTVTTKPYSGAHFAVMPPEIVQPCILAGCPEGGTVLDPFAGSGTTLAVAAELGRSGIGCELNPEYIALAERRIKDARSSVALFEGMTA